MASLALSTYVYEWSAATAQFTLLQTLSGAYPAFTVTQFNIDNAPYLIVGTIGAPPNFAVCAVK